MARVYGRGSKLLKPKMLGIRNMTEIHSLSFLVKKFGSCFDEVTLLTFFWGGEEHLNVFNATVRKRLMPIVVEMIGNGRGCLVKLSPSLASVWRHLMTANLTTKNEPVFLKALWKVGNHFVLPQNPDIWLQIQALWLLTSSIFMEFSKQRCPKDDLGCCFATAGLLVSHLRVRWICSVWSQCLLPCSVVDSL